MKSVIEGRDPDVLDALFGFYARPDGDVIDVTANARRMWAGLDTRGVTFCDVDSAMSPDVVCDFRALPFADGSASAIVYDPPHLPSAAGTEAGMGSFQGMYGLKRSVAGDNVNAFHPPFLSEAVRVLKPDGLAFCKLADFVHNHRYQWSLVDFVSAVRATPGLSATDLIIKRDPSAGNLASGRWKATHHARRAHCWWIVVRKGRCEPRAAYPMTSTVGRKVVGRIEPAGVLFGLEVPA